MHTFVFYFVMIWLALLFAAVAVRAYQVKNQMNRIQTLNTLTLPLVAMLTLFGLFQGKPYSLDAALVLALLSFVGTIAAAIYRGKWKYF